MFGQAQQASNDVQVAPGPTDTPQCLSWSPVANHLAVGSWDSTVKAYEISATGQTQPRQEFKLGGPVLDTAFIGDGSKIVSAGADKTVQLCDLASGQMQQIGAHDAPVKTADFCPNLNCVMTGSWDKTIKFWDMRSPQPMGSFNLPERCYAADVVGDLAVVATADKKVSIYNLQGGPTEYKQVDTTLKMQTRCITCFPTGDGFAVGSIEGRVAIQYVDAAQSKNNFSFKCHRDNKNIFCVNDIAFHPGYGTFATVGSDGIYTFWDKDNRNRLKNFPKSLAQITCCGFNGDGTLFAYGIGYDWSKGHEHYNPQGPNGIFVHGVQDEEVRPKPPGKK
eukprot:TRINITY_DN5591_c0_g1_i3.p1 TRINITY_DN5591_c0_g1~~TRINITY_DN5591_c0_g1_i3.p1  ORF type:complete len:335 (+),score=70.12 TRINITY_DN5591_c0_g1_i3:72-1076(+)